MRPASDSILSAVEGTDVAEDRLTEVLACVAHVNQRYAAVLVAMAGAPTRAGERYVVGTQRETPGGRRVDMEIASYRGLTRTGLVWIEVKAGAAYQPDQLPDYAAQVRDLAWGEPDGRVLTIIPPDYPPQLDTTVPARWETRTWAEVALACDRLGREWGRSVQERRWRPAAMQPSAPAQWRYLAELVRRLEEMGYAQMKPLTLEDVIAAPRIPTLSKTLDDLVIEAAKGVTGVSLVKQRGLKNGSYQTFAPSTAKWFGDVERFGNAYPELQYWYTDDWTPDRRDAPAFCAGVTFNDPADDIRYALLDEDWRAGLPNGVTVDGSGRVLRVVRTKYLAELVVAGVTFEEQVQALKIWADQAITDVMDNVQAPTRGLA